MFTGLASKARETVIGCVNDTVTNWAFFHPLEFLVEVFLPSAHRFGYCAILCSFYELS